MSSEHAVDTKAHPAPTRGNRESAPVSHFDPRVRAQRAEIRSILRGTGIQAKLTIGDPDDEHEREADRVADDVMRMPDPGSAPPPIQRMCDACEEDEPQESPLQRRTDTDASVVRRTLRSPYSIAEGSSDDDGETVQTKPAAGGAIVAGSGATASISVALGRPGGALPRSVRAFMEPRFGRDFGHVRVHADESAAAAARSVSARAFTRGAHIAFDRGQYAPDTSAGRRLLAHELAHVVQQGRAHARPDDDGAYGPASVSPSPRVERTDPSGALRRVRWSSARDTGRDTHPWRGQPYNGDIYTVQTDAGTRIDAWRPHDGTTYWCHGYTFGGSVAGGGPFSIWGSDVPTVLRDDGWRQEYSCVAQRDDILVFWDEALTHSGKVRGVVSSGAIIDDAASTLESKWGSGAHNTRPWAENAGPPGNYGRYRVYSKTPAYGPCAGKGSHEL